MEVDPLIVATLIKGQINNNYAVSLKSNDRYELDGQTLSNQLYMLFFL